MGQVLLPRQFPTVNRLSQDFGKRRHLPGRRRQTGKGNLNPGCSNLVYETLTVEQGRGGRFAISPPPDLDVAHRPSRLPLVAADRCSRGAPRSDHPRRRNPRLPRAGAHQTGKATTSTDVNSFGAFLLEVTCGKGPFDPKAPAEGLIINRKFGRLNWVWTRGENYILAAGDAKPGNDFVAAEAELVLKNQWGSSVQEDEVDFTFFVRVGYFGNAGFSQSFGIGAPLVVFSYTGFLPIKASGYELFEDQDLFHLIFPTVFDGIQLVLFSLARVFGIWDYWDNCCFVLSVL
ncbi:non-specific serine,threonine protein kinase [Sarracenia purpurea var. burkii]